MEEERGEIKKEGFPSSFFSVFLFIFSFDVFFLYLLILNTPGGESVCLLYILHLLKLLLFLPWHTGATKKEMKEEESEQASSFVFSLASSMMCLLIYLVAHCPRRRTRVGKHVVRP
jgi:hypothetical protein